MISFGLLDAQFNYRVAAVIVDDGHVLACREVDADYWFLPGGRCEMMESSQQSVARELREELDVEVEVGRLLWIVENFFVFAERRFHEMGLYFLVKLPPGTSIANKSQAIRFREGAALDLEARWISLADLASLNLKPDFFRSELLDLPTETRHIVHREF